MLQQKNEENTIFFEKNNIFFSKKLMNLISFGRGFGGIPPNFIKNLSRRPIFHAPRRLAPNFIGGVGSAVRRKNAEFFSAAAREIWVGARQPPARANRLRALHRDDVESSNPYRLV
jgi:hypothetical protein